MSIEFCPRCSARVRVPLAAEPESWVRCPRCRVETQLSEILSAEPPLLELIDGPSGEVPSYAPMLAGAGTAARGEEYNEFQVLASDTLVTDEDSPTLPLGGVSLGGNFLDDENSRGASIGRAANSEDDELFGFDDNPDVAALRTTSEDGKFVAVPAESEAEFNLSPDAPADFEASAAAAPTFTGIPTGVPRRKKKSGMLPMMIGVVGGGLFGILIAYYGILMWAMGQDPFRVAKYFPESMQMLLPESLQDKSLAGKSTPPPVTADVNPETDPETNPDSNPAEPMPIPEEGNVPNNASADATANGEGETGAVSGLPTLGGNTEPSVEKPMTDPLLDPLAMPEQTTPKNPVDPLDPLASNVPVKPDNDPLDPFGNNAPIKPEMPKPEVTTPGVDPLDPLNPGTPLPPPKPDAVDPLDPLAAPVKPEMPAKPETTDPAVDPLDPLAPKPADPLDDPLAPKPADPLAAKPVDPLAPQPVDPLADPAKPKLSEPLMLASATYTPDELQKSLVQVETAADALAQTPEDRKQQAQVYRALGHVGEVAGQLKSLGETDETAQVNLDSLQAMAKKLADDPTIPTLTKLTAFWLTMPLEKRNNGIVLQGTPGTSEQMGKLHKTSLEIPAPDPTQPALVLSVVSEYPLLPGKDGKVTVLGVIVEKPAEQIPGYTGPAERVIWASVGQMEKPAAPAVEAKSPDAAAPSPAPAETPGDDPFGDIK